MQEKKTIIKIFSLKYKISTKYFKSKILDEFIYYTGFNRTYAARLLKNHPSPNLNKHRKTKENYYNYEVVFALEKIWKFLDFLCGKRLVVVLPSIIDKLKQFNEFDLTKDVKEKLLNISASTIDRLLKPAKIRLGRRNPSMTKGTTYLIDKIPVKTFGEWKNIQPGHVQLDLVSHHGGNVFGGFYYTLTATDVHSSWTICTLVNDKSKDEMLKGIQTMLASFPFPVNGIHSDNGSEFINDAVLNFTVKNGLIFTRGRPYKKNDNPHIEQKNYSILRRNTGYLRYDRPEHAQTLIELYSYLNLYTNYFQPTMILKEKHRIGAKGIRKYDQPKTPYLRILDCAAVSPLVKKQIQAIYFSLNPFDLKRKINSCQARLIRSAAPVRKPLEPVNIRRKKEVKFNLPAKRRDLSPVLPNPFLERQKLEEMKRAVELLHPTKTKPAIENLLENV